MAQAKALAIRVAPWLSRPGDVPMNGAVLVVLLLVAAIILLSALHGGEVTYRALAPSVSRQEEVP